LRRSFLNTSAAAVAASSRRLSRGATTDNFAVPPALRQFGCGEAELLPGPLQLQLKASDAFWCRHLMAGNGEVR
jgi:hypothetical protein